MEDAEEEEPEPFIIIGDEQVDDHPFDPSLSDEEQLRIIRMARAASQQSSPTIPGSSSLYDRLTRLVPNGSPKGNRSPGLARNGSGFWRGRFRRTSSAESQAADSTPARTTASTKREAVPEPGVLLSCTHSPSTIRDLVPLNTAMQRGDIVRRPEGFEMQEQKQNPPAA